MKTVSKEACLQTAGVPLPDEMEHIRQFAKGQLEPEEVYAFSVKLCDNEIDRDMERFPTASLEALAPMFVGKCGIFDHNWSAAGQTARIYRTQIVREEENRNSLGEVYCYLKGYAYMLRTQQTDHLIREIEAGIKKEVSVGCAVAKILCSVCGKELKNGDCQHIPGRVYDGIPCCRELSHPTDAYEFSFVAVPAQPRAGVLKKKKKGGENMEQLEKEAQLGRRYLEQLRKDVARLGGIAEPDLEMSTLTAIAGHLDEPELLALREHFARKAQSCFSTDTQLPARDHQPPACERDSAFLI